MTKRKITSTPLWPAVSLSDIINNAHNINNIINIFDADGRFLFTNTIASGEAVTALAREHSIGSCSEPAVSQNFFHFLYHSFFACFCCLHLSLFFIFFCFHSHSTSEEMKHCWKNKITILFYAMCSDGKALRKQVASRSFWMSYACHEDEKWWSRTCGCGQMMHSNERNSRETVRCN